MCMWRRTDNREPNIPEDTVLEGWKAFAKKGKELMPLYMNLSCRPIPVGKWLHESKFRMPSVKHRTILYCDHRNGTYPIGFHVYEKRKDAEECVADFGGRIRKVKMRTIVAIGEQSKYDKGKTFVCKEMFVCSAAESKKEAQR